MIADGDSVARKAFRVGLLAAAREQGDTPLPVNTTQELDPSDILEVRDMAEAIARAEQLVAAPRSSRPVSRRNAPADIFESLGRRPTDDTAGPATPAPAATAAQLLRPLSVTRPQPPVPVAQYVAPPPVPVAQPIAAEMVLSLPVVEDDAYFHPAGRIRSLAEVTLDGYRPEPTLLLRARARRKNFSWILGAVLLPVAILAAIAILGRQESAATAATSTTTIATATIVTTAAPPAAPKVQSVPVVPVVAKPATATPGSVPVFDVNSLPTAGSRGKTRR
jgi:hypothetical protein